jgi:hypothetical protein
MRKKLREKPIGPRLQPARLLTRFEPHGAIVIWTCAFCGYQRATYESDAPIGWTQFGGEQRCRVCSRRSQEKRLTCRPERRAGGRR